MHDRLTAKRAGRPLQRRRVALASGAVAALVGAVSLASLPAGAVARPHASSGTTITVEQNKTWGTILELKSGWTVYRLTRDSTNKSVCSGACATAWPPVVLAKGQSHPVGENVNGLGVINRSGGAKQVTYKGVPLYRYVGDVKPGQVNGNVKDAYGQWWVVNPAHPTTAPTPSGTSTTKSGGSATPTTTPGTGIAY